MRTLKMCVLKYTIFILDIDMVLVVEKNRRQGFWHSIYWNVKANNKSMKDSHKSEELLYLQYWGRDLTGS